MAEVTAVVNDLSFMTKIRNTAEYFGLSLGFLTNEKQVDLYLRDCRLFVIDLDCDLFDTFGLVKKVKGDSRTARIRLVAYLAHVNTPSSSRALAAGCDSVLSRLEFNSSLKEILRTVSG